MRNRSFQHKADHHYYTQSMQGRTRVNVNNLLKKLKENEKKERNGNLVYAGVATAAIVISGIIIAL